MQNFPTGAKNVIRWTKIIRHEEALPLSTRISSRMVKIAAHLPEGEFLGWQMTVPTKGTAVFSSFGTTAVRHSDLEWIAEEMAKTKVAKLLNKGDQSKDDWSAWMLFEISLVNESRSSAQSIGFGAKDKDERSQEQGKGSDCQWPQRFAAQFGELVSAMREEGAVLRYTVGKASAREQKVCEKAAAASWTGAISAVSEYIGIPVRTKLLLLLPGAPSARLRAVISESISGAEMRQIGTLGEDMAGNIWDMPLSAARILPDYAARIMAFDPVLGSEPIIGVESCKPEAKQLPASHENARDKNAIKIGTAVGVSGLNRRITIAEKDLQRHWQIIGQTGTGKSTLIAAAINNAIEQDYGVTFFDPHGSTIDLILRSVPQKYAPRIRVVRIGDLDNPVPINMWGTDRPEDAEKIISDMTLLFSEIFDPKNRGFVGPRWERWFSVFAFAAIALLGKRASFESIITLSSNRAIMKQLAAAIGCQYPVTARALESEFANSRSNDFEEIMSWAVSKLQRFTSVPQLRNTLGAGANALAFHETIDSRKVTLIDLASPTIGTHAARIIGTMIMQQLWNAVMGRQNRERTHIIAIDEAHLFQTNPLPQMLAESRKFGTGMILAHQHNGQLRDEVLDALSANSANFSAFRLSVKDAYAVADRFDIPGIQRELSRLNAFTAISTLSVDGKQSPAFSLRIGKPKIQANGYKTAQEIERRSIETLVTPYRYAKAITPEKVLEILEAKAKGVPVPKYVDKLKDITSSAEKKIADKNDKPKSWEGFDEAV